MYHDDDKIFALDLVVHMCLFATVNFISTLNLCSAGNERKPLLFENPLLSISGMDE